MKMKQILKFSEEGSDMEDRGYGHRCRAGVFWIACVLLILGDFVSAQTHLRQRDFLNLGSTLSLIHI